jgi:hypothetical protein
LYLSVNEYREISLLSQNLGEIVRACFIAECTDLYAPSERSRVATILADDMNPDAGDAFLQNPEGTCGRVRKVDDTAFYEGASVVDGDDDAPACIEVVNTNHGPERVRLVRCGKALRIHELTARSRPSLLFEAVP